MARKHSIDDHRTLKHWLVLALLLIWTAAAGCRPAGSAASNTDVPAQKSAPTEPVFPATVDPALTPLSVKTPSIITASDSLEVANLMPPPPPTSLRSATSTAGSLTADSDVLVVTPSLPAPGLTFTPTDTPEINSPLPTPTLPVSSSDLSTLAQEMVRAVNAERQAEGLSAYEIDKKLTAVARAHARDMARRGYMAHTTPEGRSYSDRLAAAGLEPAWWGENIMLSVSPAQEAVETSLNSWLDDPPHRKNVLHPRHTHIGVGVAQRPEGWYVFVMDLVKYQTVR